MPRALLATSFILAFLLIVFGIIAAVNSDGFGTMLWMAGAFLYVVAPIVLLIVGFVAFFAYVSSRKIDD